MLRSFQSQSRGMLVLLAVTAFALGACGSSSGTSAPPSTPTATATSQPSATGQPSDSVTTIPTGAQALSAVTSFQFTGTYILKPDEAADVTVANSIHVISTGGFDYVDSDGTGYTQKDATGGSYADSLSPVAFFAAIDFSKGFDSKGSETENGVDAEHFVANDAGVAALKQMGSVTGVPDAQWTGELWIDKNGGFPVKLAITATGPGTPAVVFQRA